MSVAQIGVLNNQMKIGVYGCQLDIERVMGYFNTCKDLEVAAVFDNDLTVAKAVSLKNNIAQYAKSVDELHKVVSLDVIYINVSPELRYQYAKMIMNSGFDVLVDYPVSYKIDEIEELYQITGKLNKHIFLLHELPIQRANVSIRENTELSRFGTLQSINIKLGLSEYVEQMCSYQKPNEIHWFYKLPGNIFQYFLPSVFHVIDLDVEDVVDITVLESSSNILPQALTDEVIVKLSTTQTPVTISLSLKEPLVNSCIEFNYEKSVISSGLIEDADCSINKKKPSASKNNFTSCLYVCVAPFLSIFKRFKHNRNPKEIVINDFYSKYQQSGSRLFDVYDKKRMIEDVRLVNIICNKLTNTELNLANHMPLIKPKNNQKGRVLVTGGTGLFGTEVVEQLLSAGFLVRVLARKLSNTVKLKDINAEILYGDVGDLQSVTAAMKDVNYVVHAAADSIGNQSGGELSTILGTSNILEAARGAGVESLVYISSCGVYEVASQRPGSVLDEDAILERNPQMRGAYSNAKIVAESLVRDQMKVPGIQITCLRPGTYFGPGKYMFTPMAGLNIRNKIFIIINNSKLTMPLVYYKNVASAVIAVLDSHLSNSVIYNVIDEERINKQQYVEMFLKKAFPRSLFIYLPYTIFWLLSIIFEISNKLAGIEPRLTRYRLRSSQNAVIYSSKKIKDDLNWKPPYTLYEGFDNVINGMPEKLSN